MKALVCSALASVVLTGTALAEDAIPEKLTGHDGVVTQCVFHTDKAFAKIMCDDLAKAAASQAKKVGIREMHLGSADWTGDATEYLQPAADSGFESPLYLTFYLRGTDGNPAAAHAWASLYVPDTAMTPTGRLVLWEGATLGSGPPKPVARAVAGAVAKKMQPVFEALGSAMTE